MTRKRILCSPRIKCDRFWIEEWRELTGIEPSYEKVVEGVKTYAARRKERADERRNGA